LASQSGNVSLKRRASDWVGFLGHGGIAVMTLVRTPSFGLFLLPPIIHLLLAAGSFLVRDTPQRRTQDPVARLVAYAGAFGLFTFIQAASVVRPEWLTLTTNTGLGLSGIACGLIGLFLEIWAIWHLRFAFATEPAARRLVTGGPYSLARHPIYTGACIANLGLLLTHPTVPIAAALVVWGVFIRLRMQYEEAILTQAFPEYVEYQRRVGALLPGYRRQTPGYGLRATG
jgi:protein-S-isoprenylcysteine O-methyltransferase Ste14